MHKLLLINEMPVTSIFDWSNVASPLEKQFFFLEQLSMFSQFVSIFWGDLLALTDIEQNGNILFYQYKLFSFNKIPFTILFG